MKDTVPFSRNSQCSFSQLKTKKMCSNRGTTQSAFIDGPGGGYPTYDELGTRHSFSGDDTGVNFLNLKRHYIREEVSGERILDRRHC